MLDIVPSLLVFICVTSSGWWSDDLESKYLVAGCTGPNCVSHACDNVDVLGFENLITACDETGPFINSADGLVVIRCRLPTSECLVFVHHPTLPGFCEELKESGKCRRWSIYSSQANEVYLQKSTLCTRPMWHRPAEELMVYTGIFMGTEPFKHPALAEVVLPTGKVVRRSSVEEEYGAHTFNDLCDGYDNLPR